MEVSFVKNEDANKITIIMSRVAIWLGLIEVFYLIGLSDSISSIRFNMIILAKGSRKVKISISLSIIR